MLCALILNFDAVENKNMTVGIDIITIIIINYKLLYKGYTYKV